MIAVFLQIVCIFLSILCFATIYVAYKGPAKEDRIIAMNIISTKITILISILALLTGQKMFIDVALIYAMIGIITTICISKYTEKEKLS